MSKYVIKFEDNPWYQDDGVGYYKCGEIPWWSAKKSDLKKLTPLDKALDEAHRKGYDAGSHEATTLEYQQGLDDAWNAARKIVTWPDRSLVNSDTFDLDPGENIFTKYSASRAIEKLKSYEEQQKADEIKVGDEVRNTLGLMDNAVGYVIGTTIEGDYNVSRYIDGKIKTGTWRRENCVKTGKHSDTVVQLLAEMEGGAE